MTRPIGVVVIAMLLMFSGVVRILIGMEAAGITHFGLAPAMANASLIATNATISGILSLIAAFGLFTLARWAWYLAIVILIIRVTADVFGLVSYGLSSVPGGVSIADLALSAVALWYFLRPATKAAFKIESAPPPASGV
jgi:uncharacterized membrane protein (DUF2068 family)